MKKLSVLVSTVVLMIVLSATLVTYAQKDVKHYRVTLDALNNSGVSGYAELTLDGDSLTVAIHATGLEADKAHAQHIHGSTTNKRNSNCPTAAADTNGDGIISVGEGVPNYGPVLLPLTPFTTAPGGVIDFENTFTVDIKALGPLPVRAIVLHGLTVNGAYVGSTPVACGQIEEVE